MIQEIYDYLLIRSHFLFDDDMIEKCKDKDTFKYVIMNISKVMQKENYFVLSTSLRRNISDLLQAYRFDNNKDKEVNDEMNFIIERLNQYNNLSKSREKYLTQEWLEEEYEARNLPRKFRVYDNILKATANEHSLFMKMCGFKLNEENNNYIQIGPDENPMDDIDYFDYLQLLNLLANRFPAMFYENNFYDIALYNVNELLNTQKDRNFLKYVKRTLKNLKDLEKDMKAVSMELVMEKRLSY